MSREPASRPEFDKAIDALEAGDTLVITTLDRLGRSTQNMLWTGPDSALYRSELLSLFASTAEPSDRPSVEDERA